MRIKIANVSSENALRVRTGKVWRSTPSQAEIDLIELLNLSEWPNELANLYGAIDGPGGRPWAELLAESLRATWMSLPSAVQRLIGPPDAPDFQHRYHQAERLRDFAEQGFTGNLSMALGYFISIRPNDAGILQLEADCIAEPFLEGKVTQIRKCPVCNRFFWAPRTNSPACKGKCSTSLRQKRLRENRRLLEQRKRKSERTKQ
jgi:hypothetical protein